MSKNTIVTLSLTNVGNLRLQDYWVGRNSARRDNSESTVFAINHYQFNLLCQVRNKVIVVPKKYLKLMGAFSVAQLNRSIFNILNIRYHNIPDESEGLSLNSYELFLLEPLKQPIQCQTLMLSVLEFQNILVNLIINFIKTKLYFILLKLSFSIELK